MSKRAFLVLGPESSGTRLVTRCMIAAGCTGDATHEQRFDQPNALTNAGDPIVWRRSLPHGIGWPDLDSMLRRLWQNGYRDVFVLALMRTHYCAVRSQVRIENKHAANFRHAERNIAGAIRRISSFVLENGLPCAWVSYESIVADTQRAAFTRLLDEWGLNSSALPAISDENQKYLNNE